MIAAIASYANLKLCLFFIHLFAFLFSHLKYSFRITWLKPNQMYAFFFLNTFLLLLDTPPIPFQQEMEEAVASPEKAEEAKLKARYPNLGAKPGGSDFLMKRLQKGGVSLPFNSLSYHICRSNMCIYLSSSKNTSTLVTTIWPRQKWRTSSCRLPQRRRRRSQGDTSPLLRICLTERPAWWRANWLVEGFTYTVLLPFHISLYICMPFTFRQVLLSALRTNFIKPNARSCAPDNGGKLRNFNLE